MTFVIVVILVALLFDFMNGFHDAANSIATVVSTRLLRPQVAVVWAAFFNFIAFLFFGLHVATTIGTGMIEPSIVDTVIIFSALVGALLWNIITWYYGIPSSSSHALIGGLGGAALAKGGFQALHLLSFLKVGISIFVSPVLGFCLSFVLMSLVNLIFYKSTPRKVDRIGRKLQYISASLYSLGHGGNDAQKTMGIITVLLFSSGILEGDFHIPLWVVLSCQAAMAFGTLFGGWRIVKTMGMRITKLRPIGGSCAEAGGAMTLFMATVLGIPVSTTHTITGSIMGVGAVNKLSAVRWGVAQKILWAWILTVPASALISASTWWFSQYFKY